MNTYTELEKQALAWYTGRRELDKYSVERQSTAEFDFTVNGERFVVACAVELARNYRRYFSNVEAIAGMTPEMQLREFKHMVALAREKPLCSDNLIAAVWSTWEDISPDAGRCRNAEAIELVLDADRMSSSGYEGADDEVTFLIERFDYPRVARALASVVKLV